MPFKAHAGEWSVGKSSDKPNPYFKNPEYKFVTDGKTGLPQGPGLWDYVFRVNQDNWNLRAIKQVCMFIGLSQSILNSFCDFFIHNILD